MARRFSLLSPASSWVVLLLRCLLFAAFEPALLHCSKNCDWHSGHGVNMTKSPWTFSLDKTCTTLELPVRLWGAMEASGATALAKALENVPSLKRMDLDFNYIGDEGAIALASALHHVPTIAALDLKGNSIGDLGAKALSTELWHAPQLTHLDLEKNHIGPSGARALAAALRKTPMMMFLSLANNAISDQGAKAIASVLRHMPSLAGFDISNCGIQQEGQYHLAAAMATIEAGRGGEQMQYVLGVDEEHLQEARKRRPAPPPDYFEAKARDLQSSPMWRFLNGDCNLGTDGLNTIIAVLASLGMQEVYDFNIWSDLEIERNLKRSGVSEDNRNRLRKCVTEQVRNKTSEASQAHDDEL